MVSPLLALGAVLVLFCLYAPFILGVKDYANGDLNGGYNRSFNVSVNGGAAQNFAFPVVASGNWNKVGGVTVPLTGFTQGGTNTIRFVADGYHPAPDLDWIEIMPGQGWTAEAESGSLTGAARTYGCAGTCSAGTRIAYIDPNSTVTMRNLKASTAGSHSVVVYYTNGEAAARSLRVQVNGGPSILFSGAFKPTGDWVNIGSVTLTLPGFTAGTANTIVFSADWNFQAPDLDFIEIN